MTSFINCYEDIASQISRLRINDSPLPTPSARTKTPPLSMLELTVLKGGVSSENAQSQIFEYSNIYDSLFADFEIWSKVKFHHVAHQIVVLTSPTKNGIPFRVAHRDQRLLLNGFFLRVNGTLKYGSFRVNPMNGQVVLCFNSFLSSYQYNSLLSEPQRCAQFIDQELLKAKFYLRMHFHRILHVANQLQINFQEESVASGLKMKGIGANVAHFVEGLKKISPYVNLEFPFMFTELQGTGKFFKPEEVRKMSNRIQMVKSNCKEIQPSIMKIVEKFTPNKAYIDIGVKFEQEEKKELISIISQPSVRFREGEPLAIYSEIKVETAYSWDVIDQGGFGLISKGSVLVSYPAIPGPPMRRVLVRKDDREANRDKLNHEKKIIEKMRNGVSPFVAKFFYSQQEEHKNSLFIEYCAHKSLASYRQRFHETMSLETKLMILKFVAQGLKFLKDLDICHLDIKPANILFGATHVKITDFGQSYHKEVCPKNFRPGTSLPYAPPESFSPFQICFGDRLDVFSYGVLMYELIFDCYPFDYNRSKYDAYRKAYMEKSYSQLMMLAPEKSSITGYKLVNDYLSLIALKCLDDQPNKRPCIEWVIVYLQFCLNLLANLHF